MLRNKKGISPIVGVILVVAMTVLLAAIAWTYMSGMVSNPGKTYIIQPVVKKENPDLIVVRFEGKDVPQIYKVDFTGSQNGSGVSLVWALYTTEYIYYNGSKINTTTKVSDFINDGANTITFTFGESAIPQKYYTDDNGATIKTKLTLIPSYEFVGKKATEEAQSNTVKITITFKDGTTQSFEYKI